MDRVRVFEGRGGRGNGRGAGSAVGPMHAESDREPQAQRVSDTPTHTHLDGCCHGQVEDQDCNKDRSHGQAASNALTATHRQVAPQHLITDRRCNSRGQWQVAGREQQGAAGSSGASQSVKRTLRALVPPLVFPSTPGRGAALQQQRRAACLPQISLLLLTCRVQAGSSRPPHHRSAGQWQQRWQSGGHCGQEGGVHHQSVSQSATTQQTQQPSVRNTQTPPCMRR